MKQGNNMNSLDYLYDLSQLKIYINQVLNETSISLEKKLFLIQKEYNNTVPRSFISDKIIQKMLKEKIDFQSNQDLKNLFIRFSRQGKLQDSECGSEEDIIFSFTAMDLSSVAKEIHHNKTLQTHITKIKKTF